MSGYHSIVVENDGQDYDIENAKTIWLVPKKNIKIEREKCGPMAKIFFGGAFFLILIFLVASFGDFLYEKYGPEQDDYLDEIDQPRKSMISLILTNRFTIQIVALVLLAVLGKFFWDED